MISRRGLLAVPLAAPISAVAAMRSRKVRLTSSQAGWMRLPVMPTDRWTYVAMVREPTGTRVYLDESGNGRHLEVSQ